MKFSSELEETLEKISDINYTLQNYFLLTKYVENVEGKRSLKINDQYKKRIFRKPYHYNEKTKIRIPNLTQWGNEIFIRTIASLEDMRINLIDNLEMLK